MNLGFERYPFKPHTFSHSLSKLEQLLNSPNCTLEALMDDDDFLTEFRSMNSKLLQL